MQRRRAAPPKIETGEGSANGSNGNRNRQSICKGKTEKAIRQAASVEVFFLAFK
jgi:hypothetical protein